MIEVTRTFTFEAAHRLPNVPEGHKCARLHGHSYRVDVTVTDKPDPHSGMVMDFADLKAAVAPVVAELDHHLLNDIPGLENPTSELLSMWLFERLFASLRMLSAVTVRETASTSATYRGMR